jgi:membrane-associated protein
VSMILLGYLLIPLVEPPLQNLFGPQFRVAKNIDKVVLLVVFVSVAPLLWKAWKEWRKKAPATATPEAATVAPTTQVS